MWAMNRIRIVEITSFSSVYNQRNRKNTYSRSEILQKELERVCGIISRSSTTRHELCESIHEPSPENATALLDKFSKDPRIWRNEAWVKDLEHSLAPNHTSNIKESSTLVQSRFREWFYGTEAQRTVNMQRPADWYPIARYSHRTFYFHCGPTNSGKTHTALQRLTEGHSGVYCAPLKALAGQVWRQINQNGVPCDLLIGDERRFAGGAEHVSCTVEMTPIDAQVDVGVIDEVQMIADPERGWAWTRALLGLPAREIHLCGEARAIPLVKKILYDTYELKNFKVVEHKRLVPLEVSPCLQEKLDTAQNGDCFVCFSYNNVLKFKRTLEAIHRGQNLSVSYIYGGMPFNVREHQVRKFNEGVRRYVEHGSGHRHVLVATDAVAYGLNMNVERIIFTTMQKFSFKGIHGSKTSEHANAMRKEQPGERTAGGAAPLDPATVQQISGRAGRFGLVRSNAVGSCTTLHERDYEYFKQCMETSLAPLQQAGLLPTSNVLLVYLELCQIQKLRKEKAGEMKRVTILNTEGQKLTGEECYTFIKTFFEERIAPQEGANRGSTGMSNKFSSKYFFLCDASRSILKILDALKDNDDLIINDRILFSYLPLNDSSPDALNLLRNYAREHSIGQKVTLRIDEDFSKLLSSSKRSDMREIEKFYKRAEMYNWLSWRFQDTFVEREAADTLKERCIEQMIKLSNQQR